MTGEGDHTEAGQYFSGSNTLVPASGTTQCTQISTTQCSTDAGMRSRSRNGLSTKGQPNRRGIKMAKDP